MFFFTLILGIWLLSKADTLKCYECVPGSSGSCTDETKDCPSQDQQCGTTTITTFIGGSKDQAITAKRCSLAPECVGGSVDFGSEKTVIMSQCCTSDLCNTKIPEPKFTPNGRKCFSCEGQQCTRTLNCEGDEDHCIKSTMTVNGEIRIMKGCASKVMCAESSAQIIKYIGSESSCCQGDFCNSADRISVGLLLLLAPLIASVVSS